MRKVREEREKGQRVRDRDRDRDGGRKTERERERDAEWRASERAREREGVLRKEPKNDSASKKNERLCGLNLRERLLVCVRAVFAVFAGREGAMVVEGERGDGWVVWFGCLAG